MKRTLTFLCAGILAISLSACGTPKNETDEPVEQGIENTAGATENIDSAVEDIVDETLDETSEMLLDDADLTDSSEDFTYTPPTDYVKTDLGGGIFGFSKGGDDSSCEIVSISIPIEEASLTDIRTSLETGDYSSFEAQYADSNPDILNAEFTKLTIDGVDSLVVTSDTAGEDGKATGKTTLIRIPSTDKLITISGTCGLTNAETFQKDLDAFLESIQFINK